MRQVRAAAWDARLASLRATADARAAQQHGYHDQAAKKHTLAASYQALHEAYRQRETVFAAVMADRADWEQATRAQRHLAIAADAELRRRHPERQYPPLRSAEPEPATDVQRAEVTLTAGERPVEIQGAKELAAGGSGDVRAGCQPCAELRVGKGAATTQSVYRKAIVPELRRGDEVMDQLFS